MKVPRNVQSPNPSRMQSLTDPIPTQKTRNPSQNTQSTSKLESFTGEQMISTTNEPVSGSNLTKDKIQKNNLPTFKSI